MHCERREFTNRCKRCWSRHPVWRDTRKAYWPTQNVCANGLTAAVQCGELARPLRKVLSSASAIKTDSGETASVLHWSDPWFWSRRDDNCSVWELWLSSTHSSKCEYRIFEYPTSLLLQQSLIFVTFYAVQPKLLPATLNKPQIISIETFHRMLQSNYRVQIP